jgi:hypothetical protein
LTNSNGRSDILSRDVVAGRHFLKIAFRRIRQNLAALDDHDDASTTACANAWLKTPPTV